MEECAANLDFERAARMRDELLALEGKDLSEPIGNVEVHPHIVKELFGGVSMSTLKRGKPANGDARGRSKYKRRKRSSNIF